MRSFYYTEEAKPILIEGDRTYLLYAVAGESGIAIAELTFVNDTD